MTDVGNKIVIEGVTEDGRTFRPSDWIERISGSLSTFGMDRRIRYSHYVQPQVIDGRKCLVLDPELKGVNPSAFSFLVDFARGNKLKIHGLDGGGDATERHQPRLCPA